MRWEIVETPNTLSCPGIYFYKSVWNFLTALLLEHKHGELNHVNGGICMPHDDPQRACVGVVFYKEIMPHEEPPKEIFMSMSLLLSALLRAQQYVTLEDLDLFRTEAGRQNLFLHSDVIEAFLARNPQLKEL